MTGRRAPGSAPRAFVVLAALVALGAATAPCASAAGALADLYTGLGDRMDDRTTIPDVRPRPLAFVSRGRADAFPLRGPAAIRAGANGVVLVEESMTGRVLRLTPDGRVVALSGRRRLGTCSAGDLFADPWSNRIERPGANDELEPVAGTGRQGFAGDGGPATAARFSSPVCVARAPDGALLVSDTGNARVRRIGPDGVVTTIAGDGGTVFHGEGGPATAASLVPQELVALPDGDVLVTDRRNRRVLRIARDGTLTTFAGTGRAGADGDGGPATAARLIEPSGIAVARGGAVYVTDPGAQTVRRISPSGSITTVLGAPPRRRGATTLARSAWVPARRSVWSWLDPLPGRWSFGETAISEETAAGRTAVVRHLGYEGTTVAWSVVRGRTTLSFDTQDPFDCWRSDPTAVGVAGDPLQARDLQAAAGAHAPYAPGPGPYGPDLRWGRLVLARAPVTLDATPAFGEPAVETEAAARRVVEYLIDPAARRVVAMQAWSPDGYDRQYRIRPLRTAVRFPVTGPRLRMTSSTPRSSSFSCGPPRRGAAQPDAFGFRSGVALARRVNRRMAAVPAVTVAVTGHGATGRRFTASSRLALRAGRVASGVTEIRAPGRPHADWFPPGGSYTSVLLPTGVSVNRFAGEACWRASDVGDEPTTAAALADLANVVPLEGAFLEPPRRRGRLIALPAQVGATRVVSLIDPRDLRLVAQTWHEGRGGRGALRLREAPATPDLPDTSRRCPESSG